MTTFLQTAEGDLALTSGTTPGRLTLIDGATEKAQKIENRLGLCKGEWFLNVLVGMPYFEAILAAKNPDLELVRRVYRRGIVSVEGIADVPELDVSLSSDRKLSYAFRAIDDEGTPITGGTGAPFIVEED